VRQQHKAASPVHQLDRRKKIEISGLTKTFESRSGGSIVALKDINLNIMDGEFICVLGPSGCGKSSLLRVIAGLEKDFTGEVAINKSSPDSLLTSVVFQEHAVFPWFSVRKNIAYGLEIQGVHALEIDERVNTLIGKMGLTAFADAFPFQLSGGMKQRVSIARAFASNPEILLMDEPFAALDEQTRIVLQGELLRLWEENKKTVVFITHSIEEALVLADRIFLMGTGPGTILEEIVLPFERPRDVLSVKADPQYGVLLNKIWTRLREAVATRLN